jgi:serine/threonine protein kinase
MTQVTGTSTHPTPFRKEYRTGDVVGEKYRLLQLLGEGGMGSVWVAENLALKANVALKLIRADVAESSANERFLSEARLAARLQHAAIVRVFDFGKTEQDEPYIVMELLEGETLGQRLTRLGSIDPMDLCQTLLPIIDALHSAHGHGVIHRDLKPDNVFIAKADGGGVQPKLLDFGIAKLRGESAFLTTKLTQAGTLIGSPDYMSPEQARGETDLDPRSDVWALCVLAYECLVGKPPFHGDNYNALLWAIIHDEPVPITVFQAGDSELWRILKTGFAKDRNARWSSARKLGEAMAQWLENHGVVEDVCNRSLHASWLPAERPTRPELTPFDEAAIPLRNASSHAALVPQVTLPMLRRPHTMSLWFAAMGLVTLIGAFLLSTTGSERVDDLIGAPGKEKATKIKKLQPTGAPGAVAEVAAGEAPTPPAKPPAADVSGAAAQGITDTSPIGVATTDSEPSGSSWTANHEKPAREKDLALAEDFNRASTSDAKGKRSAPKAGAKEASREGSAARPAPEAKATHAARKKPVVDNKTDTSDFDFGI